jgi:hypothetical protein
MPSHSASRMPGIGRNAAGSMAVRRCEKVGMRFTMEPVVCCGKSDARAMGRKAARKEREGTAEIAAIFGDMCGGWYAMRLSYGWCSRVHDSTIRYLSPASIAARHPPSGMDWRAIRTACLARPLSRAGSQRAASKCLLHSKRSEPLGVAAPACTFSCPSNACSTIYPLALSLRCSSRVLPPRGIVSTPPPPFSPTLVTPASPPATRP